MALSEEERLRKKGHKMLKHIDTLQTEQKVQGLFQSYLPPK